MNEENQIFYVVDAYGDNVSSINVPLQPFSQKFQGKNCYCYMESLYLQIANASYTQGNVIDIVINSSQPYSQDNRNSNNPSSSVYSFGLSNTANTGRFISIVNNAIEQNVLTTMPTGSLKISVYEQNASIPDVNIEKLKVRLRFSLM